VSDEEDQIHITSLTKYSLLNIVDLAGSERLSNLDNANETANINTSLFTLTHVIRSLSEGNVHIPY